MNGSSNRFSARRGKWQNHPPEGRKQYSPGQRPGNSRRSRLSPEGAAHWHTNGGDEECGVSVFRPFRAWDNVATVFPGRCPGLYYPRLSGGPARRQPHARRGPARRQLDACRGHDHGQPDAYKERRGLAQFEALEGFGTVVGTESRPKEALQ